MARNKIDLDKIDNKTLYLNLAFTQFLLFFLGCILYFLFLRDTLSIKQLFHVEDIIIVCSIGAIFAAIVIIFDFILMKYLPEDFFDDGGVNKRLFRDLGLIPIFLLALTVAFVEEWLFRGVIQNLIGWFWASLLFALIHLRYFKKWFYAIIIIILSFGFGLMYEWTGSMWSVILAHFIIDFMMGVAIRYKWFS